MEAKRDSSLDIAKAVCISLMVLGHSGCPDYLHDFVYMFHMPCFFFVSGYLLNDKYISDIKTGLFRKAKGSYYPFVKWTLIFLLLHNLFAACHIYESSYSLRTFAERIVRAFTMLGSESLLGGFWFLISLFWASVVSLLFLYWLSERNELSIKYIMGGGNFFAFNYSLMEIHPNQSAPNVWRTNPIGNCLLSERLYLA